MAQDYFQTFPLTGTFEINQDYSATITETEYGEGSLRDRILLELNSSARMLPNFMRVVTDNTLRLSIQSFLLDKKGVTPFYVDFFGNGGLITVRCKQWSWDWISVNTWMFKASFEEIFRAEDT